MFIRLLWINCCRSTPGGECPEGVPTCTGSNENEACALKILIA